MSVLLGIIGMMLFIPFLIGVANGLTGKQNFPPNHTVAKCDVTEMDMVAVDGMDGHQFEYFCADVLRTNGFSEVCVTKGSGDQGVDILAKKDGVKYAIQCKKYASPLSNKPVQEVNAGKTFYNCDIGAVLTNSIFTPGAKTLAQATGVLLWDRARLIQLMRDNSPQQYAPHQETVPQETSAQKWLSHQEQSLDCVPSRQIDSRIPGAAQVHLPKAKQITVDDFVIEIDIDSLIPFGIDLDNFGVQKDEDGDEIVLLFDIVGKGRRLPCDIEIVGNLYADSKKLLTETDVAFQDEFRKKDSLSIYFTRKNICHTATKVELFCRKW